jgi:hypothetical protein
MVDQVHEIAAHALPDFLARIAKLSKKSIKLLGKPIAPVFHGEVVRQIEVNGRKFDLDGNRFVETFHRVSVTGETPKINGWTFMGTIDHSHAAGNILRSVPGAGELPTKYRTAEPFCDHCAVKRRRNDTFVLRCEADGAFMQIGRQCIRDFIGYDVAAFTESAKWLSGMEPSPTDGEGGYEGFAGKTRDISLHAYLAQTHAVIRKNGWVSAKEAELRNTTRTSYAAMNNMFPLPSQRHLAIPLIDKDELVATQTLEWVRSITNPKGDYEYNLTVVGTAEFITFRDTGLAASMVSGLFRHQERTIQRAVRQESLKGSQHVGTVGERLRSVAALVYGYYPITNSYGSTHIFRLRTPDNNVLVWYASSEKELSVGDHVVLDGTVKSHTSYQDVAQTVITRCKVLSKAPVAA